MPASGMSSRRLLVMLGALTAFGPLAFDMYLPGLPRVASDLHTTDAGAQLSLSLCMLGLGLGQVVVGPVSDQLGRRRPMLVGVALFTVAALVCAVAPNLPSLLVARFVGGLGGGAGAVVARSMVRDLYSGREAARAFGITALVFGVAPVVAPLLGSVIVPLAGWRGVFVVIAVCGALLLAAALTLPETLPPEQRHDAHVLALFADFPRIAADRSFLAPALVCALAFLPLQLYLSMSSFALQAGYGLTASQFGYVFALNSVGILAFGRVNLLVLDRVGPYRVLVATCLTSAVASVCVLLAVLAHAPLGVLLVPLFVAVASCGPLMPNGTTLALEKQGGSVGAAAACLGLVSTIVSAIVPPSVSLLGASPVVLGVSMAVAGLVGLLPLLAVPRDLRGTLH